jgi:putative flippase GtrA
MPDTAKRISANALLAGIPWRELLRYFACSAAALAADTAVFTFVMRLGAGWAVAATAGFCLGLVVAYVLSVRFVFKHRSVSNARAEFVWFAGIGVFGLLLTVAFMWVLIDALHLAPLPAKLLTAGAVFICNFSLRKLILFTRHSVLAAPPADQGHSLRPFAHHLARTSAPAGVDGAEATGSEPAVEMAAAPTLCKTA